MKTCCKCKKKVPKVYKHKGGVFCTNCIGSARARSPKW